MIGILQKWDSIHGYGFFRTISPQGVFHEFFLHASAIKSGEPLVGTTATFEVGPLLKGVVPPAINVRFESTFESTSFTAVR